MKDFPPLPGSKSQNSSLTDEEQLFIMQQYLRPDQISDKRILKFISSYLVCRNTAQAARDAGVADSTGHNWRQKPEIHATIEAITAKALMKYGYDASEVIERVKEIGFFDPIEFENPDGSYKTHLSQVKPEARRAVKKFIVKNLFGEDANGMKIVIGQLISVEIWDKLKGLELIGREKQIMKETKKVEHDVTGRMAEVLLESARMADVRKEAMGRDVLEITGTVEGEEEDGV